MKIKNLSIALLALITTSFAFANHTHDVEAHREFNTPERYAFMVDPISWVNGNLDFQFEMSLNDRLAFVMPLQIGWAKSIFKNKYQGLYMNPEFGLKYYVTGQATHMGFYVNPLLGFFWGKLDGVDQHSVGLTYGFRTGFSMNVWNGFYMDGYLGYEDLAVHFSSKSARANGGGPLDPDNRNTGNFQSGQTGLPGFVSGSFNVGMYLGYAW